MEGADVYNGKWEKESSTVKENLQMRATNALREISLRKNAIVYKMITINAGICNVYSMNIFFSIEAESEKCYFDRI